MKDVLSRACIQVKWEQDSASQVKLSIKKKSQVVRNEKIRKVNKPHQKPEKEAGGKNNGRYHHQTIGKNKGMAVSDISNLSDTP